MGVICDTALRGLGMNRAARLCNLDLALLLTASPYPVALELAGA